MSICVFVGLKAVRHHDSLAVLLHAELMHTLSSQHVRHCLQLLLIFCSAASSMMYVFEKRLGLQSAVNHFPHVRLRLQISVPATAWLQS